MASFNRVILMGNLTRDIELRYTPGGTAVTDASLAVNNKRKNQDNQWVDEVCYVDVTLWGRTAEVASEYLGKGSPIFVEGHLKLDMWETDGKKNSRLRVVCERMQMVGGKGGDSPRPQSSGSQSSYSNDSRSTAPSGTSSGPAPSGSSQSGSGASSVAEPAASRPAPDAGRGEANPSGDGAGYEDTDIPF